MKTNKGVISERWREQRRMFPEDKETNAITLISALKCWNNEIREVTVYSTQI